MADVMDGLFDIMVEWIGDRLFGREPESTEPDGVRTDTPHDPPPPAPRHPTLD